MGRTPRLRVRWRATRPRVVAYFELVAGETDVLSFGTGEFGRTVEEEAADIRAFANPGRGLMLMAKVDGELAGIVAIHRFARSRVHHRGELGVSVQQKFWGLGIGRALCEVLARRDAPKRSDVDRLRALRAAGEDGRATAQARAARSSRSRTSSQSAAHERDRSR